MTADSLQFAKALADGTRQEILRQLCCRWLTVNELVLALAGQVQQPTVSHHLRLLEEADLVHGCGRRDAIVTTRSTRRS